MIQAHLRNNNLWNSPPERENKHTPLPDLLERLHERLHMQVSVFHFAFHNVHVCSIRDISGEGYSFLRSLTWWNAKAWLFSKRIPGLWPS